MAERPKKASPTPVGRQVLHEHSVRLAGVAVGGAVFVAISKYFFGADLRIVQIALFACVAWTLTFVLDHLQSRGTGAQAVLTASEKQQAQKMEAIGRLAGGVAHDFNNLLAIISGYSDLLLQGLAPSDLNRTKLEQIKQAANSAAALTRQLLMFSRQQIIQPVIMDINQVVSNTEKMLRRLIKEHIEFTVMLEPNLDRVNADPSQIEQIILNLVVNARDAMPGGGKLCIQTSNVRMDHPPRHPEGARPGDFVLVEVTDTGTGMDHETQAHVFEPFFTTKPVGQGTGLGLATVYGIVKQSNGHIEVQSTLGRGTSFKMYLPAVKKAEASQESGKDAASPRFSGETVLVVEDAPALRDLICEGLSKFGCTVIPARTPQEALQVVRDGKRVIDLLLTDVIMPEMDGPALAQEVRSLCPRTKILYMTGYSSTVLRMDMFNADVSLIRKPFTPADLARKVRRMLPEKSGENKRKIASRAEPATAAKAATAGTQA